jgi:hypothetical protein
MKSKDFIRESELDQLVSQQPKQPGIIGQTVKSLGQGLAPNGVSGALRGLGDIVKNTSGTSAPSQQSFYKGPSNKIDQISKIGSVDQSDEQIFNNLKQLAKGHMAKQSTGDEVVDDLLKKAGLLK